MTARHPSGPDDPSISHQGWHLPLPETLPRPTYWPAVLAFGIVTMAFGVVTTIAIVGVGLLLSALAIGGWIRELLHGH